MRNDLNSIIFEGTVTEIYALAGGRFTCVVVSKNIAGDTTLPVKALGKLADICFEKLKVSDRIRVVGGLRMDNELLYLNAEHFEYAP